jgi:short-subunit dehydrogenase
MPLGDNAVAVRGDVASLRDVDALVDRATAEFVPLLREGGGVVLTTSVANGKGLPMVTAYAAGKAALRSMTRSLARELLPLPNKAVAFLAFAATYTTGAEFPVDGGASPL